MSYEYARQDLGQGPLITRACSHRCGPWKSGHAERKKNKTVPGDCAFCPDLIDIYILYDLYYNKRLMASTFSGTFRFTIIALMIVSGAINTLAYKVQNKQLVYEGCYLKYFFHPYMQGVTIFFGEVLALFAFFFLKRRNPELYKIRMLEAQSQGKQLKMNKLWLLVPASCDFVASTLQIISLNFIPGSLYQMTRGGTIVTTFIFSITFLKTTVKPNQLIGSGLALLGVFVVGLSSVLFSGTLSSADSSKQILGFILLVISLFFSGFYFVFEQKLLQKYHLEPLEIVGYEGVFGLSIYVLVVAIISFVPCPFGPAECVFTPEGFAFLEGPLVYLKQVLNSGILITFSLIGTVSIATFNIAGVTVTKEINALARSICDVSRTILVWVVGIVVTVTAGRVYPNYEWEMLSLGALGLELGGFLILVCGNLVYNNILTLPCLSAEPRNEMSKSLLSENVQNPISTDINMP